MPFSWGRTRRKTYPKNDPPHPTTAETCPRRNPLVAPRPRRFSESPDPCGNAYSGKSTGRPAKWASDSTPRRPTSGTQRTSTAVEQRSPTVASRYSVQQRRRGGQSDGASYGPSSRRLAIRMSDGTATRCNGSNQRRLVRPPHSMVRLFGEQVTSYCDLPPNPLPGGIAAVLTHPALGLTPQSTPNPACLLVAPSRRPAQRLSGERSPRRQR